MRLFFALLPEPSVRETLARRALHVQRRCGGRALPIDSLHLTLVFLGQVPDDRLPILAALTSSRAIEPGALSFERFGAFARRRIVWAGVGAGRPIDESVADGGVQALTVLQRDVRDRVTAAGLKLKDEAFRPHVSVLRDASSSDLAGAVSALAFPPLQWAYDSFALMASVPTGGRHRYVELARSPLPDALAAASVLGPA